MNIGSVSLFEKIQKLKRIIFYLLVFILPTNLGFHFVEEFAYVNGLLVDYLIPTLYLQDVLIIILLVLWFIEYCCFGKFLLFKEKCDFGWKSRLLFLLLLVTGLSVITSLNFYASFFAYIKLFLYIAFAFYVAYNVSLKNEWRSIVKVFAVQVFLLSLLGIFQWFNQGSIFNNYLFFGEQPYNFSTFGIAKESLGGKTVIPIYGTFRHPNTYGAYFSVVLLWIIYSYKIFKKDRFKYFLYITTLLGVIVVLLTFSLNALISLVFGLFVLFSIEKYKGKGLLLSFIGLFLLIVFSFNLPKISDSFFYDNHSFYRRASLYKMVEDNLSDNLIFGVGYNASSELSPSYIKYYDAIKYPQPVHNIFLLVFLDSGIFAFAILVAFFISIFVSKLKGKEFRVLYVTFFQFVVLGLFDHFLFTMHQTSILLWLTVGFYFAYNCCNTGDKLI